MFYTLLTQITQSVKNMDIKKIRYFIYLLVLVTLLGCEETEETGEPTPPPPPSESMYLQMAYRSDTDKGIVAARTTSDRTRLFISGGDMIVAQHAGIQTLLNGDTRRKGLYGAKIEAIKLSDSLTFSIKYLPVEARQDRWYPSDIAYVDRGAGEYVGNFSFTDNFLQISVGLLSPVQGTTFHYKGDRVFIQWSVTGADSALVNTLRLMAFHQCTGDSVELYKTSGGDKLSGNKSITIDDMFEEGATSSFAKLARTLINFVEGKPVSIPPEPSSSLLSRSKIRVNNCDINLYAIAEKQTPIGAPFASGHVSSSVYQLKTIYFRNRNTGKSVHYYGVSDL